MLTYVLMEKLPKINVLKIWSIIYNAPYWILITTSSDFMSLSKRDLMTPRAGNQVAGLGSSASDFIQKVLSSYLSQDTGYPDWGFCGFSQFLQTNLRTVLWCRLQQCLPLLSQVISHYWSYHSTLYSLSCRLWINHETPRVAFYSACSYFISATQFWK
jgi:hypothetical protein